MDPMRRLELEFLVVLSVVLICAAIAWWNPR
jgi:hypothetical protein